MVLENNALTSIAHMNYNEHPSGTQEQLPPLRLERGPLDTMILESSILGPFLEKNAELTLELACYLLSFIKSHSFSQIVPKFGLEEYSLSFLKENPEVYQTLVEAWNTRLFGHILNIPSLKSEKGFQTEVQMAGWFKIFPRRKSCRNVIN